MVSGSISLPYSGFFSPFPHGTSSLSVSQKYLALPDGSGCFTQNFSCSALLRILLDPNCISSTGLSPSTVKLSSLFYYTIISHITVLQPHHCRNNSGLGSSAFARRYLRNHYYFLFLRVLRCFSSPGLPSQQVGSNIPSVCWVAPFGNLRLIGYWHLIVAYRSLSRPSSPLRA